MSTQPGSWLVMFLTLYFLSGDHSACLKDKPQKAVKLPQRLPGELYNGDDQCSRAYGDKSSVCPAPFLKEVSFNKNKTRNEKNNNKRLMRIENSSSYSSYKMTSKFNVKSYLH